MALITNKAGNVSKGKGGAIGVILIGIGMIIKAVYDQDYSTVPEALTMITGGLSLFGIRIAQD